MELADGLNVLQVQPIVQWDQLQWIVGILRSRCLELFPVEAQGINVAWKRVSRQKIPHLASTWVEHMTSCVPRCLSRTMQLVSRLSWGVLGRPKWCFNIWPQLEVKCSMGRDSVRAGSLLRSCSKRLMQLCLLQVTSSAMAALLLPACILPKAYKHC